MFKAKVVASVSLASVLLTCGMPVPAAETTAAGTATLGEVIVTATRREESLQDVPMSVAVVSGDALVTAGAVDFFNDSGFSTANVVYNSSGSNPFLSGQGYIAIRGISGRSQIYLDDVLLGPGQAGPSQLVEIDHVEFLRGPQGTTFGRDTIAGAINLLTRKPSFSWTGSVDATVGSFGLHQERGYVSGPIVTDKLAFSLSGFSRINDGVDQTVSGKRVNDTRAQGGRASLLLRATEDFDAQLSYDYTHDNPHNIWAWHLLYANPGAVGDAANPDYIGKVLDATVPSYTDQTHQGETLRINWRLGTVKLTSITAYRSTDAYFFTDNDRVSQDIYNADLTNLQHQFTEELRLDGTWRNVRWLTGLFFFDNYNNQFSGTFLGKDGTFFGPVMPVPELAQIQLQSDHLRSTAVYGSLDVPISDRLSATVGGRYTWDIVKSTHQVSGPGAYFGYDPAPPNPALQAPYVYPTVNAGHFDPSLSLTYKFSKDANGYVSVATGYQAAANSSQSACEAPTVAQPCQLKPEEAKSYEVGLKSELWDHRAKLNVAAFYMDYRDLQIWQSFFENNQQIWLNTNAGKVSARGVEMEFTVVPTPALTFDGSIGYEHTKYDYYPNGWVPLDDGSGQSADLTGTDLPFAPHWTGAVNGQYQQHLTERINWLARLECQYRSSFTMASSPARVLQTESQTNLNAAIGLSQASGAWSAWLRGRNILNKRYANNGDINFASNAGYVVMSDPSVYSVELRYSF